MVLLHTPICDFGLAAPDFALPGTDGKTHALEGCKGPKGFVVMFICNHCPYVKAIWSRLIEDVKTLQAAGIQCIAISANDADDYPEDGFEAMKKIAQEKALPFPYLYDETQSVAKAYNAICTPDFFGYNVQGELQYRGRLDDAGRNEASSNARRELVEAMLEVAKSGKGPEDQTASMGCSIKWKDGS